VLLSVAQVWRATAAPYGPLFVIITKAVAAVFGTSLISEILALRLLELMGVALIITSLCRLARIFGADPGIALWLGVLSPLALYSFISSGHNDALMLGLLLTGVTLAMERHPVAGVVLCALGAMIKLPAAAGIVFIIAGQFTGPRGERRWAAMAKLIVAPVVTVVVVTLATGLGWRWLGPSALRIPAQLRILATPAVSIGASVYHVLHLVGLPVTQHACVTVLQTLCGAAGAAVVIWLVIKARTLDVTRTLGIALLVIVLVGPTLWPWYFTWGLILLAATPAQRAKPLAVVAGLAMFLVGPSGSPMLGGIDYLAVTLACAAGLRWLLKDQRWMDVVGVGRRVVTS
ncbi:MAG: polyprenol phosphomannose-dependent alpha 1,6 mannosyltransferase MptB, partial [Acidimicrobiales bacterium]